MDQNPPDDHQPARGRPAASSRAPAPSDASSVELPLGVGVVAEIAFPTDLKQCQDVLSKLAPSSTSAVRVLVPELAVAKSDRELTAIWTRLSKGLVGKGFKSVAVSLPPSGRLLAVPGLFGSARQLGDPGDDHWTVAACRVDNTSVELQLRRQARAREGRRVAVVRAAGCHVVAHVRGAGQRFQATAYGLINHHDGRRRALVVEGPRLPNPTSAVAEAVAAWLERFGDNESVTLWLGDGLVRAAVSGQYAGPPPRPYKGVNVPDMQRALVRLERAIARCQAPVTARPASSVGAIAREVVGLAMARRSVGELMRELGLHEDP